MWNISLTGKFSLWYLRVKFFILFPCNVSPYDNTTKSNRVEPLQCWMVISHFHKCTPNLLLLTWDSTQPGFDAMTYIVKKHQLNLVSWLESKHIWAKIHRQSSKQLTETWDPRPKTQSNVFQEARCLSGIEAAVKWSQLVFLPVEVSQNVALLWGNVSFFFLSRVWIFFFSVP